jgi:hypothetical protein
MAAQFGLQVPSSAGGQQPPVTQAALASAAQPTPVPRTNVGGVLNLASAGQVLAERRAQVTQQAAEENAQPVVQNLSAHIDNFWTQAKIAKLMPETLMLSAVRARRGEYDPDVLQDLRAQGSSEIFMMLTSTKCRQAASLLRDTIIGSGSEKPWTLRPNPAPELPLNYVNDIMQGVSTEVQQMMNMGVTPGIEDIKQRLRDVREQVENSIMEEARVRCARMEAKMESQLDDGGFLEALDAFIDDLTTFKTAFMKGPVIRKKPKLQWGPDGLVVTTDLKLEWERVDPFMMYPAPWAKDTNSSPLIERHRLSRKELEELIGVEGYSEANIREVLELYGNGGLHNWISIDAAKAEAEGRNQLATNTNTGLIDALQYWGSVSGKLLIEWGMDPKQVPDPAKEYEVECWKIGRFVIKAALNQDPLARRPYYADSYERVPGVFWGNSLYDLMRDCQDMCNATARAMVNNMGIASGPQVAVNTSRLPQGADLTQMYPWKIWQFESDPVSGSAGSPIQFFSPDPNAPALMQVYEHFSDLADEYTGIPKYMAGQEGTPGAGRTASGLSMMIGNASKIIKQVIGSIDTYILDPIIERLYYYNMRYGDDPDLKGDIHIVARGAMSLATKEAAQVRRNEFLQVALMSPMVQQIIGADGIAALLREMVKTLDMDSDKVIPTASVVKQRAAMAAQMQAQQAAQGNAMASQHMGLPPPQPQLLGGGQRLMNGAPATDHFSPPGAPPGPQAIPAG